jgi:hypothetical protein
MEKEEVNPMALMIIFLSAENELKKRWAQGDSNPRPKD